ncbi:MAG: DUF362 domain-containing protein [Candidatus Nanoarchaeia archaeon]
MKVILKKGKNRKENILNCLAEIKSEIKKAIKNKKRIIIKPNFVNIKKQLAASHVDAAEAIIEFFKQITDKPIIIAESSAQNTNKGYKNFHFEKLKERHNVPLIDLNKEPYKYISLGKVKIRVARMMLNKNNFIISLTKPKTHNAVIATLSIKNLLMGSIIKSGKIKGNDKGKMHHSKPDINYLLAKLSQKLYPDLSIIDGYTGMEGNGPVNGKPVKHRIAIASLSPIAADLTCLKCMSIPVKDIGYLTYIKQRKNPRYKIDGNISACKRKYKLHKNIKKQLAWKKHGI